MDRRVIDLFVVLLHFEVGEDSVAGVGVRHDSATTVNESSVEEHFEDVPNRLHEIQVHSFVVVFEVDPSAEAVDDVLPLSGVAHDDALAGGVVFVDAHLQHLFLVVDLQLFVDFVLHGEAVAVPSESPLNVVSRLRSVSADHVFDGARCDVAVVGHSRGERRAIVESVGRKMLRAFELLLEGIDGVPIFESLLFFFGEVDSLGR